MTKQSTHSNPTHYCHPEHSCHPEFADFRTDGVSAKREQIRIASRLSSLWRSHSSETLRAWRKSKTVSGATSGVRKCAFTLAEVLITLAIIGIVAAITLPTVMSNYKKKVVVTKLRKFYTTMNQAVKLSSVENGDADYWNIEGENLNLNPDATMDWYNKYLAKYFNGAKAEKINDGIVVRLNDGTGFAMYTMLKEHIIYYIDYKTFKKWLEGNDNKAHGNNLDGRNVFLFIIRDNRFNTYFYPATDGEKQRTALMHSANTRYGCADTFKAYCAALIENDGWEIKDDYPVKF